MKNTTTTRFLKRLSKKEIAGLNVFITNPYFNTHNKEEVIRLYQYMIQFAPDYNHKDFTKENAFKALYPSKVFHAATLNGLMNKLFALIKKFISCTYAVSNSVEIEFYVLRFCAARFSARFKSQFKKAENTGKKELKGEAHYRYMLTTEELLIDYLALSGSKDDLAHLAKLADQSYWLSRLSLLCEMLNRQINTSYNYDFSQLDVYLSFLEQTEYIQSPLIRLWYFAVSTFKNILYERPVLSSDYLEFKSLLVQNENYLSHNERRNLYIYLKITLNKVVLNTAFNEDICYQELFDLQETMLKEEHIFLNGYLTLRTIKNIMNAAIRTKNVGWAEEFLTDYRDVFRPKYAKEAILYCQITIQFHKENFKTILQQMNDVIYEDIFFRFEKRVKFIQVYHEIKERDLFDDQINSFAVFLARNREKPGDINVQPYRDFKNFINRIANTRRKDMYRINKIEAEIQKIPARQLPEKQWLLKQLDKLK